jgi:hypothetical protein
MEKRGKRVSKCVNMGNLYPNPKQHYNHQLGRGIIAKRPLGNPISNLQVERELELSNSL